MTIENDQYLLQLDPATGSVCRIYDEAGQLELIAEPALAESFRLLLPLPGLEANYILGGQQSVPSIEPNGTGAVLKWEGPLSNENGEFDITVTVRIELIQSSVQFHIAVENRTELKLAEVWHAFVGGMMGLGERLATETLFPTSGWARTDSLFRTFPEAMGVGGGGGMRFPEYYLSYPNNLSMPWMSIYNSDLDRGVYYACHDTDPRMSTIRFEMHPGLARNRQGGNWPTREEIEPMRDKYPPGLVMNWTHFPYTRPGDIFESPPVVLQTHEGDWHEAAKLYRGWFASQFPIRSQHEGWLRSQQAVQDTMFLLPEGNVMMAFKDIPKWASEAREYGVRAVMVSGWNVGGHDNQYPNYSPDPRLGTWDDLEEAIRACHGLGVKVFFFANVQPADSSTDWYQKELHKYRVMNTRGQTNSFGFGMGTLGARMGMTCPPLVLCDAKFPEYRTIIVEQMLKLAQIGADGIHLDKLCGTAMNFNPDLETGPDQALYLGLIECIEEMLAACREINPGFCLGVESSWDRTLSYADAWWNWHDMTDHVAVMKYTFPEYLPTLAVVQPWDYTNVNNAVRYGYQILAGPARYSVSMGDEQSRPIAEYLREVIRIREDLKDTLFFGEFLDTREASVEASDPIRHSVHRNTETGRRACVLANLGTDPSEAIVVFQGNDSGKVAIHEPFKSTRHETLPLKLTVPGERLAIVVEA